MRTMTLLLALCLVGCGLQPQPKKEEAVEKPVPKVEEKLAPKVSEFKFGEKVVRGDLEITVTGAKTDFQGGYRYGEWSSYELTGAHLRVKNNSAGKIHDWQGWHGMAVVSDEHGNTFKALNTSGWQFASPPPADVGEERINPGATYTAAVWVQALPPTSKEMILKVPLGDETLIFRGPVTARGQRRDR